VVLDRLELILECVGGVEVAVDEFLDDHRHDHPGGHVPVAVSGEPCDAIEHGGRVPLSGGIVVVAHRDEPLIAEVHVDLGQGAAEGHEVGVVIEALQGRPCRSAASLVEGAIAQSVLLVERFEFICRGVAHVGPGGGAERVCGDHTMSVRAVGTGN
jgi:hypothetical protein